MVLLKAVPFFRYVINTFLRRYLLKILGFLAFSGAIEMEHRSVMS